MTHMAHAFMQTGMSGIEAGVVKQISAERLLIQADQGIFHARKADSCLVAPSVGDRVLLCRLPDDVFVLAILQQADTTAMQLAVPGELSIESEGDMQCVSRSGTLRQRAGQAIEQLAPELRQTSREHHVVTGKLHTLSSSLRVQSDRLVAHAEQFEGYVERCYMKAQQVVRSVEGLEHLNIGNWIQMIRNTFSSRARHSQITAEQDVRVDAKRIHMG